MHGIGLCLACTAPTTNALLVAVRLGAWIKKTFSLKPALERIRERRRDFRSPEHATLQIERMR